MKKYNKNAKKRNYTNYQGQYTKESGVYAYLMPKEIFNYSTNKTTRSPGVNNRVGIRNNKNLDTLAGMSESFNAEKAKQLVHEYNETHHN